MQLAILAAVLGALATAEFGGGPVGGVAWRLSTVAAAMLLAPLAAFVGALRLTHAPPIAAEDDDLASQRLQGLVVLIWISASAAILFALQWPQIVRGNWQLGSLPLVDELLILTPLIASLVLVWASLYQLERASQASAVRFRGSATPLPGIWPFVWLHIRHHLGLIILPSLVAIGLIEALGLWFPSLLDSRQSAWLLVPALLTMLLLMPLVVRRMWRTTPLPAGALRNELDQLIAARRCPLQDVLLWHTGGRVINAAVVGLSRFQRYVLLSDGLVTRLTTPQVAAVVRHELAHLSRGHLPLRLALLGLPLAVWMAVHHQWPGLENIVPDALDRLGLPAAVASAVVFPLVMLLYAVVVVGTYSRRLEHQADLDACHDEFGRFQPLLAADFVAALRRVTGRGRHSRLSRWLHPSLTDRLSLIARAGRDTNVAPRYHSCLRWAAWALVAAYLLALLGVAA